MYIYIKIVQKWAKAITKRTVEEIFFFTLIRGGDNIIKTKLSI